jgi:Flp pilus assembly protein TadG
MSHARSIHRRARFEWAVASTASVLAVVTLVWHDWIEIAFGADPDEGSGAVEWAIVLVLALVASGAAVAGSYEMRQARAVSQTSE